MVRCIVALEEDYPLKGTFKLGQVCMCRINPRVKHFQNKGPRMRPKLSSAPHFGNVFPFVGFTYCKAQSTMRGFYP